MGMNVTVLVLALGGGILSPADAQQRDSASPEYGVQQEPPPILDSKARLYRPPEDVSEAMPSSPPPLLPKPPPRTNNYPNAALTVIPPDPDHSVQVYHDGDIRYVSGGIGAGEREELNALSSQFNLRLLFAMQDSGDYLADVQVNIMDAHGAVILRTESYGPWFFAQLPPGAYTVEVAASGQTQRQTTRIDRSHQARLNFYWR